MLTTLNIDEAILEEARRRARADGVSLGRVFEDAFRLASNSSADDGPTELPVLVGDGLQTGVDLTTNRSIQEFLDSGRELDQLRR